MRSESLLGLLQQTEPIEGVEDAPCYFPIAHGRYDVKPGLFPFGTDFRNGAADQQVFQCDRNFAHYRQIKRLARLERLSKYSQTCNLSDEVATAIAQFIIHRLVQDQAQHYQVELHANEVNLHNGLTGDTLTLNANYQLRSVQGCPSPPYASTLDAVAAQVQEDFTIVSRTSKHHWISAIHLCFPNHWSAEEKIGKSFAAIHAPVAGMEKLNRRGDAIVHTMINHKPMVRFAWGLSTDTRLNHHPVSPSSVPSNVWQGRHFEAHNPSLYLRIERQVIWGFPNVDAALFTIRTYFRDCRMLKQDPVLRSKLVTAIQSMTLDSLVYKGLEDSKTAILKWLDE
ncbi:DUF3445 domain-containing protein [Leptolyngbyaceae cyanobacterium UHCC 1019]